MNAGAVARLLNAYLVKGATGKVIESGTSVPADTTAGYAKGCIFQDLTNGALYVNVGTVTSCNFDVVYVGGGDPEFDDLTLDSIDARAAGALPIGAATATSLELGATDADTTIKGNATVKAELDANTAAPLLIGKATATGVVLGASDADTTISGNLKTTKNVGTAEANCTAVEYGDNTFHQTVLTLNLTGDDDLDLADGDHGAGAKVYTFPEGRILILGATIDASVAHSGNFNATPNDTFNVAVGTAAAADDNDLTGTEADIIPKSALDTESGATTPLDWESALAASAQFDGTAAAKTVNVNVACADTANTDANTFAITGTLTITWVFLGDYGA